MKEVKFNAFALRFVRVFASSAIAVMATVAPLNVDSWGDLAGWFSSLALAGVVGGISGVISGLDKLLRWSE